MSAPLNDARRFEDEGELRAQTALETLERLEASALLNKSTLKSSSGSLELYECTADMAEALKSVSEGVDASRLHKCLARVREVLKEELAASGLVALRKMPLHASPSWSRFVARSLVGQGVSATRDDFGKGGLSNDAPAPTGSSPDVVCVCCCVPGNKSTHARFARVKDLLLDLSAATKKCLKQSHCFNEKDDAAPLLTYDDDFRPLLRYSPELRENVEWHPRATDGVVAALGELERKASDRTLGLRLPLRADDVFIFDARRWLYALDLVHDTSFEGRFLDARWVPHAFAQRASDNADALPATPLIPRHWFSSSPRDRQEERKEEEEE